MLSLVVVFDEISDTGVITELSQPKLDTNSEMTGTSCSRAYFTFWMSCWIPSCTWLSLLLIHHIVAGPSIQAHSFTCATTPLNLSTMSLTLPRMLSIAALNCALSCSMSPAGCVTSRPSYWP